MALRGADADAASALFAAEYPRLAGWCRGLLDSDQAAHDVASEAFTRLLGRWHRVDDPRGYLYVVATNLVRRHWRRTARGRELRPEAPEQVTGPDHGLRDLVERLPARLRAVVLLHYYVDLSVADVARLLGRPEGTVKSDLHRARAVLLTAMEGQR